MSDDPQRADWRGELMRRLASLHLRPEREAEIVDELSQHLDDFVRELVAGGATVEEARRAALADLDVPGELARRMRSAEPRPQAHRAHERRPPRRRLVFRHSLVAVLIVALGAAAAAVVFTAQRRLTASALPYRDPARLVALPGAWITYSVTEAAAIDPRLRAAPELSRVSAYQPGVAAVAADGDVRRLAVASVDTSFFAVFDQQAARGRVLDTTDRRGARVAVVSWQLGQRLRAITGDGPSSLRIDGLTFDVVGVMPPRFTFPADTDVWVLFDSGTQATQGHGGARVIARLAPGRTIADARSRLAQLSPMTAALITTRVAVPLVDELAHGARPILRTLFFLCLLLMVATCVDVAALGLVAGSMRAQDAAIRVALGATKARLILEEIVAAAPAAIASSSVAVGLSLVLWRVFGTATSAVAPDLDLTTFDWSLIIAAIVVALAGIAALVAGRLLVLWHIERRRRPLAMTVRSRGLTRLRRIVIAAQVATAFVLVSVTLAAAQVLIHASRAESGLGAADAVSLELSIPRVRYDTGGAVGQLAAHVEERLRQRFGASTLVGITNATVGHDAILLPIDRIGADARATAASGRRSAITAVASVGYFPAAGVPVVAGRVPDDVEWHAANRTAIVSRRTADVLGVDPHDLIGREIVFDRTRLIVAAVVADTRLMGPQNDVLPIVYTPIDQRKLALHALEAIVSGPGVTADAMTSALRDLDPDLSLFNARRVGDYMKPFLRVPRLVQLIATGGALLAVLLAAAAIYGLLSYEVTAARLEIAIRMALGESVRSVRLRFARLAGRLAIGGIVAGLVAHVLVWQIAGTLSRELQRPAAGALATSAAVMIAMALWASRRPASNAAAISPASALKG
jgi:hypothetical protein